MWTTAVRYAFNKTLQLTLNNRPTRRPTSTVDTYPHVLSPDQQSDDAAFYSQPSPTGRHASFKPQYAVPIRRPRTDAEAQRLYNHVRTVAWYLDSLPLCSSYLPFDIGVESIVGFIPVVGDYIGLVLGIYQVYLCSLFGLPIAVILWMIVNVVLDCFVGLVPVVGDLLDVAFKSNLRNLYYLEDHLQKCRGNCGAGTFYVFFPPPETFIPQPSRVSTLQTPSSELNTSLSNSLSDHGRTVPTGLVRAPHDEHTRADFINIPASAADAEHIDKSNEHHVEAEGYLIPDEPVLDKITSTGKRARRDQCDPAEAKHKTPVQDAHSAQSCPETSTVLQTPLSTSSQRGRGQMSTKVRRISLSNDARPRVSWHDDPNEWDPDDKVSADQVTKDLQLESDRRAEPLQHVWRRRRNMYLVVYSAIFCVAYVTSLDSNTAYLYLNFACSEYGALASFSTVAIVQQMIYAVAKPPIAKLSDVFGRPQAYGLSLFAYICGYLAVASSTSLRSLIGGICLQSVGNTGVQVLQAIIIADTTTAKWRGLAIGIVNLPFLINFAVAGPLVDVVMRHGGWRSGFALWTFLVPISALPLLVTLAVGQRRARRAGLAVRSPLAGQTWQNALEHLARELDLLGLTLFTGGWLLILLPLTLAGHGERSAELPMTAFIIGGLILLLLFVWWETKAAVPILPYQFLSNRAVVCICLVGVLDFASFYISWTFLSSFIQILKGWDQTKTGYFATTQNVTSTIIGIVVGSVMAMTRRYKTLLIGGLLVRLVGAMLMIRFRTAEDPTYMLVLCQLLQGVGGGSVAITMQVAVQVTVRHADVAIVTALELLTTEIGAAIGSATAGWVFQTHLPAKLARGLPDMDSSELKQVYGSLQKALSYPIGSSERSAIMLAWVEVMRILSITATLTLVPAVLIGLAIPDTALPDVHGAMHHHGTHSKSERRRRRGSSTFNGEAHVFIAASEDTDALGQHDARSYARSRSVPRNRYSDHSIKNSRPKSRDRLVM